MSGSEKKHPFFKIPQTKIVVKQNVILGLGLIMFIAGIFLLVASLRRTTKVFAFRPVLLMGLGVTALFMALAFARNSFLFFVGLFCSLVGVVTLLIDLNIVPYTMKELWPLVVISLGLALIPAGLYHLRRIRTIYLFPAIVLIIMGGLFLLFSLKIVKIGFLTFVSRFWPLVIMAGGVALIVVFCVQQHHKGLFVMKDDSLVDSEDD